MSLCLYHPYSIVQLEKHTWAVLSHIRRHHTQFALTKVRPSKPSPGSKESFVHFRSAFKCQLRLPEYYLGDVYRHG
jgi:hypothetical protein